MKMRIQKFIAQNTRYSRRAAEKLIAEGGITMNDKIITEPGSVINPETDTICVHNKPIQAKSPSQRSYIALHKPEGYLCSCSDPHYEREKLLTSLLDPKHRHLVPVGRLDKNTTGLIMATDDGEFIYQLTHPKFQCEKEYLVTVKKSLSGKDMSKLEQGMHFREYRTSPCRIHPVLITKESSFYSVVLQEGKKRQIRKMFDAVGNPVIQLKRFRIGHLRLGDLKPGEWRYLGKSVTTQFGKQNSAPQSAGTL